jgi:8-oxo-dGTP diphosphatase
VQQPHRSEQHDRAFVGIYPVNARGEILLQLRDDRPDLSNPGTWTTLGGLVEPGESAVEAAQRELLEECGQLPEALHPFKVREQVGRSGAFVRVASYAAAVDWTLDDVVLGEGQAFAWLAPDTLSGLPLNPIISEEILDFAASPLRERMAAVALPYRAADGYLLPPACTEALGIVPESLVAVHGIPAGLAARLRAVLPRGARLTASPAPHECPAVVIWRPGMGDAMVPDAEHVAHARAVWLISAGETSDGDLLSHQAGAASGFTTGETIVLTDSLMAVRLLSISDQD